jgi:hypothetical protein
MSLTTSTSAYTFKLAFEIGIQAPLLPLTANILIQIKVYLWRLYYRIYPVFHVGSSREILNSIKCILCLILRAS